MKRKNLSVLLSASMLLTFCGCQNVSEESSSASYTSMLPESSSAVSSSRETPAPQYSLEDIAFSENPEIPGSLEISYPSGMLSGQPLWIDATHIYLQPKKKAVKFGVIADLENRTFTQTPEQYFLWTNIGWKAALMSKRGIKT